MKPIYLDAKLKSTYSDKIDLVQKSLEIYKLIEGCEMTQRDKDILTMCFIFDINSQDFNDKVIAANIGIKSVQNITTMKHRLKKKGFIEQDKVKMKLKHLVPGLQNLKNAVMTNDTINFQLMFSKSV